MSHRNPSTDKVHQLLGIPLGPSPADRIARPLTEEWTVSPFLPYQANVSKASPRISHIDAAPEQRRSLVFEAQSDQTTIDGGHWDDFSDVYPSSHNESESEEDGDSYTHPAFRTQQREPRNGARDGVGKELARPKKAKLHNFRGEKARALMGVDYAPRRHHAYRSLPSPSLSPSSSSLPKRPTTHINFNPLKGKGKERKAAPRLLPKHQRPRFWKRSLPPPTPYPLNKYPLTPYPPTTNKGFGRGNADKDFNNDNGARINPRSWRFWAIFVPLCVCSLLAAFETTVTSTALPAIVAELKGGDAYVWVLNGYLLTSTVSQPLYAQLSFFLGRRHPSLLSTSLFLLGSGISGFARSTTTLIAGRVVQGLGGGGIMILPQIIVSDLFSVRDRGRYFGIVFGTFGIGTLLGPVLGGVIVENGAWRWVFLLNLPLAGAALVCQLLFLHLPSPASSPSYTKRGRRTLSSLFSQIQKIDWLGTLLLSISITSILIALSWADTRHSWSSHQILLPLLLGLLGTLLFHTYERSPRCTLPTIPPILFANPLCATTLLLTFLHSLLTFWRIYFLPLYFQSVLLHTPSRSGILLLPSFASAMPVYLLAGWLLTRTGRYKPLHLTGCLILLVAAGLYTTFSSTSGLAEIIVFQSLAGISTGMLLTTLLPAAQADLPQSLVTAVTGTFGFMRSYGSVLGIAIPAAIFNARFEALRHNIGDERVRGELGLGRAYQHGTKAWVGGIREERTKVEVVGVYEGSLRIVWQVALGLTGVACLLVLAEREVPLLKTLEGEGEEMVEREGRGDREWWWRKGWRKM